MTSELPAVTDRGGTRGKIAGLRSSLAPIVDDDQSQQGGSLDGEHGLHDALERSTKGDRLAAP